MNSISKLFCYYTSDQEKTFFLLNINIFFRAQWVCPIRLDTYGATTDASNKANFVPINKLLVPSFTWAISIIFINLLLNILFPLLLPSKMFST